jgi:hypothetical protein
MEKVCKKCGGELKGKQMSYCSLRCSKLHLKALYRKRNGKKIYEYNKKWRKTHRQNVLQWETKRRLKRNKKQAYVIACVACPNGEFVSFKKRKICPIHNPHTPKKLRFQVLARDNFTCQYCGRKAPDVQLQVDHVKARKNGGTNEVDKLVTSCVDCNIGKGTLVI